MHFHPFIFNPTHNGVILAACQELSNVCIDGVDRQNRLRMEAISDLCKAQLENIQALFESNGRGSHVVDLASFMTSKSSHLMEITVRSGEIAADTQRQVVDLLERFVKELTVQFAGSEGSPGRSRAEAVRGAATRKRKKVAA